MAYLSTEETSAITQNWSSRERVKDSFTRLIHSCQCHFTRIYACLYLQLPLDDIDSVALEWIVRGTLAELSKFSANLKSFDFFVIAK